MSTELTVLDQVCVDHCLQQDNLRLITDFVRVGLVLIAGRPHDGLISHAVCGPVGLCWYLTAGAEFYLDRAPAYRLIPRYGFHLVVVQPQTFVT